MEMNDVNVNVNDTQEIQITVEQVKEELKLCDALDRLLDNPDFKEVILENYIEKTAIRLVSLRASPMAQTPEALNDNIKNIDAIGMFQQYLYSVEARGMSLRDDLANHESMLDQLDEEAGKGE